MLRREYHNKDADSAEKDTFIQRKINNLKEWKASAMTQLQFLYQKLRIAVPISELQATNKKCESETQRANDYLQRNAKLAEDVANLEKKIRTQYEAEEKLEALQEDKEAIQEEYGNLKLESLDTSGYGYNELKLWRMFIPQNVRESQEFMPQVYENKKHSL